MKTPVASILMFVIAALLGAVGQFLYREGAAAANAGWASYLINGRIWLGVLCYIAVMVLFVAAFKLGGQLTVLYPIYASTFIWAAGIAWWRDGEPIGSANLVGMITLVLGMYLMGR